MAVSAPPPVELTREMVRELEARTDAGEQPAAYVIRNGIPVWVTVSCEGVVANIQPEIVEPDLDRGYRVATL